MRRQEYRGLSMLTSDKNAEPTIVKFPVQTNNGEREWRLDDDEQPIAEKEWKLDDPAPNDDETAPSENTLPETDNPPENSDVAATETVAESVAVAEETVAVAAIAADKQPENPPPSHETALPPVAPKKSHWQVYAALLGAAALSVWFSHQSINAYWQQTYHKASPLESLNHFALWQMGAKAQNAVNAWLSSSPSPDEDLGDVANETVSPQNQTEQATATATKQPETPNSTSNDTAHSGSQDERAVFLNSGDKVLFVGDSIMQGIAPHVQRWLKSQYQIDSLNLSKQSTGLAYPKFFDWPTTIEQTLQKEPNIKLIVVLLGANDPWDFPNPQGGAYLKFQSPEWNAEYLSRVNRIIQAAEQNQTRIIWLGVPYMRRQDLDKGVRHLNQILGNELVNHAPNVVWLPTDMLLSDSDGYQDSMKIDGETVRIRTKDGVHLNPAGQQFMSNYLNSYIKLK